MIDFDEFTRRCSEILLAIGRVTTKDMRVVYESLSGECDP